MKKGIFLAILGGSMMTTQAQIADKKNELLAGKQNIEKLCGCFDVEFKYAETFSPDTAYKFHAREEISAGLELVLPIEVSDKKIVLQHLLLITDSMIIKHWREDWTYENPTVFNYKGDKVWVKEQLKPEQVKGRWTQSVWEVSDAPRYQGVSEWIQTDGKTFWQSTSDAPLPRREYSVRNDYTILKRTNRINITNAGWVHEQDNQKIIRKDNKDKLLVEEKGINSYTRTDDNKCAAGKAWWGKNKLYWNKVRTAWEAYAAVHLWVAIKETVNGKVLHEQLNSLAKEFASGKIRMADIDTRIKSSIENYMSSDKSVTGN